MSRIPSDTKKIRARISAYERNLKKANYRDGSGSRFLIGPFYMILGDVEGALTHYKWFDKKFPDSVDEPFHVAFRCLSELRAGNLERAEKVARRMYLANPFLIPRLLGVPHGQSKEIRRGRNWEEEEYVTMGPQEFFVPWGVKEREWLLGYWRGERCQEMVCRHVEIEI